MIAFYLIFSIYIIKNSKRVAESICGRANLHGEINLSMNKTELLFALFIGIGIYGLIQNDIGDSQAVYDNMGNFIGYDKKSYSTEIIVGAAGTAVGVAMALYSIHFSNKASDLKREARKTKLKTSTENISIPGLQNGFANNKSRQFKVSLVIPL